MNFTGRVNLDRLLVITGAANPDPKTAYTQVWWTPAVEAVRSPLVRERDHERVVFSGSLERNLVGVVPGYLATLRTLGVNPPVAIFISLVGVRGASLDRQDPDMIEETGYFDRDIVHTSEIVLREWPGSDRDAPQLLRPAFDEIAYAAGRFGSRNYVAQGNWQPPH